MRHQAMGQALDYVFIIATLLCLSSVYNEVLEKFFPTNRTTNVFGSKTTESVARDDGNNAIHTRPQLIASNTPLSTSSAPTPSRCGDGLVTSGGKCYKVLTINGRLSWFDANLTCSQHGGRLFTVNYLSDLDALREQITSFPGFKQHFRFIGAVFTQTFHDFPHMYARSWVWTDGRIVHTIRRDEYIDIFNGCVDFLLSEKRSDSEIMFIFASCLYKTKVRKILCEIDTPATSLLSQSQVQIHKVKTPMLSGHFTICPANHFTHTFLACDVGSSCWGHEDQSVIHCDHSVTPLPPPFVCTNQQSQVPYTLLCDFRKDCVDGSDESFCQYTPCKLDQEFECNNHQCVRYDERCDRAPHCIDRSDEELCERVTRGFGHNSWSPDRHGPYIQVSMSQSGFLTTTTVTSDFWCPDTHFWCPDKKFCLPAYLRCNGIPDCPNREDEAGCDSYTCPGSYRCRGSAACLSADLLCDGLIQCPQWDDELLCGFNCTQNCTCSGMTFFCRDFFPAGEFPQLRFLDGTNSGLTPADLENNTMLVHLSLVLCGLTRLSTMRFPNLLFLDLSKNLINQIKSDDIVGLSNLRILVLASNPFSFRFITNRGTATLNSLLTLDLSDTNRKEFSSDALKFFPGLISLNLSHNRVEEVLGEGFQSLTKLRELDLQGCPMSQFPRDIFQRLEDLQNVYADNYKLCCPVMLPKDFNIAKCHAPENEISSCDALLRSPAYRVFLSLFAGLSLLGNTYSFIYRIFINQKTNKTSFGVFVTHLCVSDFLMGVYLTMIGIADLMFKGTYLWNDLLWTTSAGCSIAGFISMLSSEVSVSFIGHITLDRFIVIRFPFTTRRFRPQSAQMASGAVWVMGFLLAAVPLLPATSHWNFYSQTGICIPLPITRKSFPGQNYSFGVMIILNLVLFLIIGTGQGLIYKSITGSRMTISDTTKASKDVTVARRLLTVVMSDFLCWFPIGLLGLLASNNVPVPGEVNVAIAIFVLPINSALNPFLYTINTLMEKTRRLREEKLEQQLLAELNTTDPTGLDN